MGHALLEQVREWLAAERSERADAADEAFRHVFRLVPRFAPPPAFADRVLATARGSARVPAGWPVDAIWLRPLIAASLLLSGLAALGLSVPLPLPRAGSLLSAGITAFSSSAVWMSRAVDAGLSVWALLGDVGLAARAAVCMPVVAIALILNAALALASLIGLKRFLAPYEETI